MKVNQQDWNNYTKELNLSIKRLASDLDFLLASAEVDCLETNASESNKQIHIKFLFKY